MPMKLLSPRRVLLLGLMLAGLVMLADGVARAELAWAVEASLDEGAHLVAPLGPMID